jgi:hypothetical protein
VIKTRNRLLDKTKSEILTDEEYGIKLQELTEVLKQRSITNLNVWINSDGMISKVIESVSQVITKVEGLPVNILERPTKLNKTKKTTIGSTVNYLLDINGDYTNMNKIETEPTIAEYLNQEQYEDMEEKYIS